jgi:serine/threonine protein kinase
MDEIRRDSGVPDQVGPFRVLRRLGAGGMAEAFEAVRAGPGGFEQRVCIKRVLPGYSTDEDFVRLFLREARLAAALSHRNITRVVDFGQDAGCHYLALELVDGIDLRRLLRATAPLPLPPGVVALVGMEVAEALDHAHNRGGKTGPVIHRDISPSNILASVDGDVKLTDFGISKALNDAAHTRSELVRGNLWYMAPEQLDGTTRSDPRSDLFSLGVVLYELLAGRRPYDGPTDIAAMRALSEGRRTPLVQAAPNVPGRLAAVVEHLLAHAPDDRPPSAAAVAEALAAHTSVARERRQLAALVREHRHHVPKRRAVALAPITEDLREVSRAARPVQPSAPPTSAGLGPPATPSGPPVPPARRHAPPPPTRVPPPQPPAQPLDAARAAPKAIGPIPHPANGPSTEKPRASLPPRWQRYAFAPGTWASADRAAAQRRAEGRPLHALGAKEADAPPVLPRSPALWLTLAAGLATCIALGSCFWWALT